MLNLQISSQLQFPALFLHVPSPPQRHQKGKGKHILPQIEESPFPRGNCAAKNRSHLLRLIKWKQWEDYDEFNSGYFDCWPEQICSETLNFKFRKGKYPISQGWDYRQKYRTSSFELTNRIYLCIERKCKCCQWLGISPEDEECTRRIK